MNSPPLDLMCIFPSFNVASRIWYELHVVTSPSTLWRFHGLGLIFGMGSSSIIILCISYCFLFCFLLTIFSYWSSLSSKCGLLEAHREVLSNQIDNYGMLLGFITQPHDNWFSSIQMWSLQMRKIKWKFKEPK